jgi:hypothetical protein
MLNGFQKADPPTTKQLPVEVEADVPEYLVQLGLSPEARKLNCAVDDLTMIAFYYYLLRIGEYTTKDKGTCSDSIQSRRRNSRWDTSPSLPMTSKGTFAASLGMLQLT